MSDKPKNALPAAQKKRAIPARLQGFKPEVRAAWYLYHAGQGEWSVAHDAFLDHYASVIPESDEQVRKLTAKQVGRLFKAALAAYMYDVMPHSNWRAWGYDP